MEDFGYKKDQSQSKFTELSKRGFLIGATLFSIACFIYITINAYYFVYQDDNNSEIEVIKAEGPIKVVEEKVEEESKSQIDRTIYEDIFGNKSQRKETSNPKIRTAPAPVLPPKNSEPDRRLVKENSSIGEVKKEQKIIVFSDSSQKENASKDLLTKTDGKERTANSTKSIPAKSEKRKIRVQLAAMSSKNAANESWSKVSNLYPKLFSDLKPFIEEANLGKRGMFYRLQIGNFFNQIEAEEFCNKYIAQTKKTRGDCIIVE